MGPNTNLLIHKRGEWDPAICVLISLPGDWLKLKSEKYCTEQIYGNSLIIPPWAKVLEVASKMDTPIHHSRSIKEATALADVLAVFINVSESLSGAPSSFCIFLFLLVIPDPFASDLVWASIAKPSVSIALSGLSLWLLSQPLPSILSLFPVCSNFCSYWSALLHSRPHTF